MADSNLITIDGQTFIASKNIKVFPCAFRGRYTTAAAETETGNLDYTFDPESFFNTEYNYTHIPGINNSQISYIIDYTDGTLKCVIGGYYFELYNFDLNDLKTDEGEIKTLYIKTREVEMKEGTDSPSGANEIDRDRYTYVLASWKSGEDANSLDLQYEGNTYYFTGILCSATPAEGATASLDVAVLENNTVVLNKNELQPELYHGMSNHSLRTTIDNIATKEYSFAQGNNTEATGIAAHAEGTYTVASGESSHAEGYGELSAKLTASGEGAHAEGYKTRASGRASHAEGENTRASGTRSHTEGYKTKATKDSAHAEGKGRDADDSVTEKYVTASGVGSHAEGFATEANADYAHAEGYETEASGTRSHAEGYKTIAKGLNSHAEGSETRAVQENAHAEGIKTIAGNETTNSTLGKGAHAEGEETIASGNASHAEGYKTKATCSYTHAEGYASEANADYSHAEGYNNKAGGEGTHVSGKDNIANGKQSFVTGLGNSSNKDQQTVVGKYNNNENGEFIVGIGADADNRKNALVVNGLTTTIKKNLIINNDEIGTSNKNIFKVTPTQTDILTATNNIIGTTNTITGNTNTINVGSAEKIKVVSDTTTIKNTNLINIADKIQFKVGDNTKEEITDTKTGIENTTIELKSGNNKVAIDSTKTAITGNADIGGTLDVTGKVSLKAGNLSIGGGNNADTIIKYKAADREINTIKFKAKDTNGCGVIVGGSGLTAVIAGEADSFENNISNWGEEKLYLVSDADTYICTNTDSANGWSNRKTWTFGADGNLTCPGTIDSIINTSCSDTDAGKKAINVNVDCSSSGGGTDWGRFYVYGSSDNKKGCIEIATGNDGDEPIYIRQYKNDTPVHTFVALDGDGYTTTDNLIINSGFRFNNKISMYNADGDAGIFNVNNNMMIKETGYIYTKDAIRAEKEISAPSFNAKSDARLKENLRNYEPTKSILDLPLYKYDFINGEKDQIGCLAQDLQQIAPELVTTMDDGYLAIRESKLVYLLLDEIKKLNARIDELEEK